MEMRQIRGFIELATVLNFRLAASHLHITQPALSRQIRLLEDEIGVPLFDRDRHGVALTYAGEIFLVDLQDLVGHAEYAVERARRATHGTIGLLRVGFISTAVTSQVLPPLISKFREVHPHVEVNLQNRPTVIQMRMLLERTLDIAIVRLPVTEDSELEVFKIHTEPHVLLLPESHPLAVKKDIRLDELKDSPFVMYSRQQAAGYHDMIMRTLNNQGFSPLIAQEVGEMYTLVSMVSAGFGVAISPSSTLSYNLQGVIARQLPSLPESTIGIAFRKHQVGAPGGALIDMARQMAAN